MTQHQTAESRNRVERTGTIFVSDSVEMSVKAAFRFWVSPRRADRFNSPAPPLKTPTKVGVFDVHTDGRGEETGVSRVSEN